MVMVKPERDPEHPTVVVVDDDEQILRALRRALRSEPYEVLTTQDPFEAWSWIKSRPVDLLIIDEFMPAMQGTELLEAARRHSLDSASIVITGHPNMRLAARAMTLGVDMMVMKPWEDERLRESVRKLIHARPDPLEGIF